MVVTDSLVVDQPVLAEQPARADRWAPVRRWATVTFFVVLALSVAFGGIPEGRESLLLWVLAGLGTRCLGLPWRSFGRVLLDWIPFTAVLVAYDYSRGIADNLGIGAHIRTPANIDRWLFHGTLPTYWLQQHLYDPGAARWYDGLVTIVYTSHFVVMPIAAVILWVRNREAWKDFIGRIMGLSVIGLLTYIVCPWAPPWYAARTGDIPPIVRLSSRGWDVLHLNHATTLLTSGQAAVNDVAAMPSLHAATATVVTLYFLPRLPLWGKIPLAFYPFAMGFVLVYSGEHYVIDLLIGYLYGIGITLAAVAIKRWLARRRAVDAALDSPLRDYLHSAPEREPASAGHAADRR